MNLLFHLALTLVGHDVQHHVVGNAHGIGTNARKVVDAAVNVVVDDAFGTADAFTFHGKECGKNGGAYSRGNLKCAAGLGSVTYHSRKISNHVLHRIANVVVVATHEIGDAATAAY